MNTTPPTSTASGRSKYVLPVLCVAQFMVILDVSIVNIALPSIERSLHVSQQNLQWVVTSYQLALGGFLLLGGRCADLLGRRRMLMLGITIFSLSSLGCGLAPNIGFLIVTRALQGLGSALTAPAALSILTTVYSEGAERNKALGIWGALGGSGAAAGVLLGGIITNGLGWEWIFFVNVPVGLGVLLLSPRVLPESIGETVGRHFDAVGAVLVTSGLVLGVYAVNRSIDHGWSNSITLGCVVASLVLLAAFLLNESRAKFPLMRLSIFRLRAVSVANALALLVFGSIFGLFFMLSLYMQQVLGYSALKAGLAYFPLAMTVIISAIVASQVVTKVGPKPVLALGMTCVGLALLLLSRAPVDGHYLSDLLPAYLLAAVGLGCSVVPVQVAAFSGVPEKESGLAAGLINTTQEIGGALMVATVATVSISRTRHFLTANAARLGPKAVPAGLTAGFHAAFVVVAILAFVGVVIALVALPGHIRPPADDVVPNAPPATPPPVGEPGISTV